MTTPNDDLATLATALLNLHAADMIDLPDALDSMRRHLTSDDFATLCAAIDICPIHTLDIEICIDDDSPCQH